MIQLLVGRVRRELSQEEWEITTSNIPADMRTEIERYRRWEDRHLSLLSKLLLAEGLKIIGKDSSLTAEIKRDDFGRPFICEDFDFNISHSGSVAVCAFSMSGKVGVDVEIIRPVDLEDFKNYMTAEEMRLIKESGNVPGSFFSLWTQKESAIKADGRGFSIPIEDVSLADGSALISGRKWSLTEVDIGGEYSLHVAANPGAPSINVIETHLLPGN